MLSSDDGATVTHNLFGLDLIHADDGSQTRILLSDGLGSARTEMVGNSIETSTTYEPYGNLLARTGQTGTVYGFTGEEHDAATGLVYLRARYYGPSLRMFISKDPWSGNAWQPATLNSYTYVSNNPANKTDPSGLCEEYLPDEGCWRLYEEIVHRFPKARNRPHYYNLEYRPLAQLPYSSLLQVLRDEINYQAAARLSGWSLSHRLRDDRFYATSYRGESWKQMVYA